MLARGNRIQRSKASGYDIMAGTIEKESKIDDGLED